tara:strand:- start:812 stop:2491 length:1680 start_codon:yes stop_codon:yes gene_type:complete
MRFNSRRRVARGKRPRRVVSKRVQRKVQRRVGKKVVNTRRLRRNRGSKRSRRVKRGGEIANFSLKSMGDTGKTRMHDGIAPCGLLESLFSMGKKADNGGTDFFGKFLFDQSLGDDLGNKTFVNLLFKNKEKEFEEIIKPKDGAPRKHLVTFIKQYYGQLKCGIGEKYIDTKDRKKDKYYLNCQEGKDVQITHDSVTKALNAFCHDSTTCVSTKAMPPGAPGSETGPKSLGPDGKPMLRCEPDKKGKKGILQMTEQYKPITFGHDGHVKPDKLCNGKSSKNAEFTTDNIKKLINYLDINSRMCNPKQYADTMTKFCKGESSVPPSLIINELNHCMYQIKDHLLKLVSSNGIFKQATVTDGKMENFKNQLGLNTQKKHAEYKNLGFALKGKDNEGDIHKVGKTLLDKLKESYKNIRDKKLSTVAELAVTNDVFAEYQNAINDVISNYQKAIDGTECVNMTSDAVQQTVDNIVNKYKTGLNKFLKEIDTILKDILDFANERVTETGQKQAITDYTEDLKKALLTENRLTFNQTESISVGNDNFKLTSVDVELFNASVLMGEE